VSKLREDVLEWAARGHLKPGDVQRALEIAGATPQLSDWGRFLQALLLWVGIILLASGVIFFFAYNWQSLHRFGKFGLAEALLAATLVVAWRSGTRQAVGQGAILGAALATGALLALFGQTYQTGAGAYELFAIWAGLILPWVIVARFAPLWLLWVGLLDVSAGFYFQARPWGMLGFLFGTSGMLWTLFGLNACALAAWEAGLARGVPFLNRWGARVLAALAGGFATAIGIIALVNSSEIGGWSILVYLAWMLAVYLYYRRWVLDVFMLAGAVLSAVVTMTAFLSKHLLTHGDASGFLFIGLVVIAMSGWGAWWIRNMVQEEPS
jgi:uncharacterized membrane protein